MRLSEWKVGPLCFSQCQCVKKVILLSALHTLFVASFTGLCALTWINFFPTGFRIYDKKTSVQMDYQVFSIKGGVQSYNLCPGNYENPALALGH